jgi:hypothetical protein
VACERAARLETIEVKHIPAQTEPLDATKAQTKHLDATKAHPKAQPKTQTKPLDAKK